MYKVHFRRILFFAILGLAIGLGVAFLSPKVYQSRIGLILGSQVREGAAAMTPDVADILRIGIAQDPMSESELLRGEGVYLQALSNVAQRRNEASIVDSAEDLYLMYDVQNERTASANSNVAILTVKAYDPEVAAEIANEIGNVYNDIRRRSLNDRVNQAVTYLKKQVELTGAAVRRADAEIKKYREQNRVVDMQTASADVTRNTTTYTQQSEAVQAEIVSTEAELRADRNRYAQVAKRSDDQVQNSRNPVITQYEGQLTDLQRNRALLVARYFEDSPQVKEVDDAIRSIQTKLSEARRREFINMGKVDRPDNLAEELRRRISANESRLQGLYKRAGVIESARENNERIKDTIVEDSSKIRELERDRQILEANYARYRAQGDELTNRVDTAGRAAEVFFVARPNPKPVAPDPLKLGFIFLVAGLCLGAVYSFSMETMKFRVHTSGQLQELTGISVVASVPVLPRGAARKQIRAMALGTGSPSESFRYMAVSMLASEATKRSSVVFTSVSGIGRANPATQFAVAAAKMGRRVLIVDCDFTDATVSRAFDVSGKPGISDILSKTALPTGDLESLGYETKTERLFILPTGNETGAKISDFDFQAVGALATALREKYDLVVYVASPGDESSDASVLGALADEVFLVVSARRTPFRNIPMSTDLLKKAGAKNVSVVLLEASLGDEPFSSGVSRAS